MATILISYKDLRCEDEKQELIKSSAYQNKKGDIKK